MKWFAYLKSVMNVLKILKIFDRTHSKVSKDAADKFFQFFSFALFGCTWKVKFVLKTINSISMQTNNKVFKSSKMVLVRKHASAEILEVQICK